MQKLRIKMIASFLSGGTLKVRVSPMNSKCWLSQIFEIGNPKRKQGARTADNDQNLPQRRNLRRLPLQNPPGAPPTLRKDEHNNRIPPQGNPKELRPQPLIAHLTLPSSHLNSLQDGELSRLLQRAWTIIRYRWARRSLSQLSYQIRQLDTWVYRSWYQRIGLPHWYELAEVCHSQAHIFQTEWRNLRWRQVWDKRDELFGEDLPKDVSSAFVCFIVSGKELRRYK